MDRKVTAAVTSRPRRALRRVAAVSNSKHQAPKRNFHDARIHCPAHCKAVIVLLAIVVLNFFLIRMAPGDPALVMAGEGRARATRFS